MTTGEHPAGPAAEHLRKLGFDRPAATVVLGSGLSSFADGLDERVAVSYADVPGSPSPGVSGHGSSIVQGRLGGRAVLVFSGRVHFYEGRERDEVDWQVRLAAELGGRVLVITNAAGGIDPGFEVGDIMLIADQISMVPVTRAARSAETFAMAEPYAPWLRDLAKAVAPAAGVMLREGVYMGSMGPSYETPAEISMARRAGVHAVGMSTVAEVQAARSLGLEVLGLSLITNVPLPGRFEETTHSEVLDAGKAGALKMLSLVAAVLQKL